MADTPSLLLGFLFALFGAALVQLYHWQKVVRAQKARKKTYATPTVILIDALVVLCSAGLGVMGVLLLKPPPGYLVAAMIGIAPFPTLQGLWKIWGPKRPPAPPAGPRGGSFPAGAPPPSSVLDKSGGGVRPQGGDFDFDLEEVREDKEGAGGSVADEATFGEFLFPGG